MVWNYERNKYFKKAALGILEYQSNLSYMNF